MWWLISLVAIEEKTIRSNNFYRGHYYPILSTIFGNQDINSSIVFHLFRRSRANAQAKLRAERARFLPPSNRKSVNAKEPSASACC